MTASDTVDSAPLVSNAPPNTPGRSIITPTRQHVPSSGRWILAACWLIAGPTVGWAWWRNGVDMARMHVGETAEVHRRHLAEKFDRVDSSWRREIERVKMAESVDQTNAETKANDAAALATWRSKQKQRGLIGDFVVIVRLDGSEISRLPDEAPSLNPSSADLARIAEQQTVWTRRDRDIVLMLPLVRDRRVVAAFSTRFDPRNLDDTLRWFPPSTASDGPSAEKVVRTVSIRLAMDGLARSDDSPNRSNGEGSKNEAASTTPRQGALWSDVREDLRSAKVGHRAPAATEFVRRWFGFSKQSMDSSDLATWMPLVKSDVALVAFGSGEPFLAGFKNWRNFWWLTCLPVAWWTVWPSVRRSNDRRHGRRMRMGPYRLIRPIGSGGMGTVYLAKHKYLRRDVAVKVLKDSAGQSVAASRFEREVQLTSQLRHPNTIAIFDYGRSDANQFYYVMEYVDGITLQQLVDRTGRQHPARVIHLLLQVCGSLSEAHAMGMIHRDIKPANLLLSRETAMNDLVKVVDFGLIKEVHGDQTQLTRVDSITGTPMYMSPESVRNPAASNTQSDLYSVAAVGYTLLCGKPLFDDGSSMEICVKQIHDEPAWPHQRCGKTLPTDLEDVLMTALRKDPGRRFLSVDDFATALRHCRDATRWTEHRIARWWQRHGEAATRREDDESVAEASEAYRTSDDHTVSDGTKDGLAFDGEP